MLTALDIVDASSSKQHQEAPTLSRGILSQHLTLID